MPNTAKRGLPKIGQVYEIRGHRYRYVTIHNYADRTRHYEIQMYGTRWNDVDQRHEHDFFREHKFDDRNACKHFFQAMIEDRQRLINLL
jgi:hypothetical protein